MREGGRGFFFSLTTVTTVWDPPPLVWRQRNSQQRRLGLKCMKCLRAISAVGGGGEISFLHRLIKFFKKHTKSTAFCFQPA